MKKKIVVLLSLVLVVCSLFCACGKDTPSVVVTVITNSGEKQEFTSTKEFYNACDGNEAYFEKEYLGATVTLSAPIESVENDITSRPIGEQYVFIDNQEVYIVNLVDNVQVVVLQDQNDEVISMKKGDVVEVTSKIQGMDTFNAKSFSCLLHDITQDSNSEIHDGSNLRKSE